MMGADLIVTSLWTTKRDALDWEAGRKVVSTVIAPSLDSDQLADLGFYTWYDDPAPTDEEVRAKILAAFDAVKSIWGRDGDRDSVCLQMGPVVALVTGGLSWGDDPTDTYTLIQSIPEKVLEAVGFYQ